MNPEMLQVLLELHQRSLKFGSPLIRQAFERLVPRQPAHPHHGVVGNAPAPDWGASPSLLDALRLQQLIVEEVVRIQSLLLSMLAAPWSSAMAGSARQPGAVVESAPDSGQRPTPTVFDAQPVFEPPAEERGEPPLAAEEMLKQAERLLLLHPMAAQAAFSALVAQGRRYAATPQGESLARALSGSPILSKLRRIWETTTLNMLEEQPTTVLPNMYVEAIFRVARDANLEDMLGAQRKSSERG